MKFLISIFLILILIQNLNAQSCGIKQNLSTNQTNQINTLFPLLDTALKNENFTDIDNYNQNLKTIFGSEAGKPEIIETYYELISDTNWLDLIESLQLSRQLIDNDSLIYVNLWKTAKGMSPLLNYQPHSIYLRTSAEFASGLLKLAKFETDISRKNAYTQWATRTLDSLLTMQLPNGAFPFPDLRTYNDPIFSSIINQFMIDCGNDSSNVLQNGWIIDDKNTGEFKFDAGIIANAFYEAYLMTNNITYKNAVINIANYFLPLKFNLNYNYNSFVSLGLTRGYQLTGNENYLNRALLNIRFGILPGQTINGRWFDGHNAKSVYHNLIIQNTIPTYLVSTNNNNYYNEIQDMSKKAIENLINYTLTCESATGFRWIIKSYYIQNSLFSENTKNNIRNIIGMHINQSNINGKYLDLPTIGDYLELLQFNEDLNTKNLKNESFYSINPNPTTEYICLSLKNNSTIKNLKLIDAFGKEKSIEITLNSTSNQLIIHVNKPGIYFLSIEDINNKIQHSKIIVQ